MASATPATLQRTARSASAQRAPAAAGGLLPLLLGLFFLSGISGLIYQVLWLRMLALVFGVTTWAASTVLASFMAGLALGSFGAGRLVDRARRPLLWYGVVEVLVAFTALATPWALQAVERLYVALFPALTPSPAALTAVRFVLSFLVLIVPTTLMGATLPIVVKSSLLRSEGLGQQVSLLYATNTAGAILGVLLAGFYLIGGIGLGASFTLAAGLNLLVGAVAVAVSLTRAPGAAEAPPPAAPPPAAAAPPAASRPAGRPGAAVAARASDGVSARARRLVLLVIAVSGFTSFALEVVWFRLLALYVPTTTYAFTIMLAAVLCGITAGSYLVAPLMRKRLDWLAVLVGVELAIAVASLLSLPALTYTYDVLAWIEAVRGQPVPPAALATLTGILTGLLAIVPATLLMGAAFPIGLRIWTGGTEGAPRAGERIGVYYALNLVGAILGSLVAGFVLLPWLGTRSSVLAVATLSLLAGLLLLTALPGRRRALALGAGGVLAFLAVALTLPDPFAVVLEHRYRGERLLWREEGVQTTVTVHQLPAGNRRLYLDGYGQAEDVPATTSLHRTIGHMPLVLHPGPRRALVVGLGGGVTAGAMGEHGGVEVDVVELSASVVRGADWFRHVNNDALRRPNVRLRVDDGRNFLLLTRGRYDVVTADVIHPDRAGAGNLYSVQYFRLARSALETDGLMLQWIDRQPETRHKLIMRTFLSVFPDATLWSDGEQATLMVGTTGPLRLDPAALQQRLERAAHRDQLAAVGLADAQSVLARYWAGPEELHRYVGPGPVLTDDRPMVEYFLSLPRLDPLSDLSAVRGDVIRHLRP